MANPKAKPFEINGEPTRVLQIAPLTMEQIENLVEHQGVTLTPGEVRSRCWQVCMAAIDNAQPGQITIAELRTLLDFEDFIRLQGEVAIVSHIQVAP